MVIALLMVLAASDDAPLQVTVKTPEDLVFKTAAERQYLIFNLMVAGRAAYEKGDFATAADKWEQLLRVPDLLPNIDAAVRPLAVLAKQKIGSTTPLPERGEGPGETRGEPAAQPVRRTVTLTLSGTVTGGGGSGPGGAIIYLKRLDAPTPRPKPQQRVVNQHDKRFMPRVIAVPVGSTVDFANDDPLFHNVFSLSRPNDFDLGLYKGGTSKSKTFETPGVVQLLCNIHSSMLGYIYVVDTPWFAQADGGGKFIIKGVPAGEYLVHVWHEAAAKVSETKMKLNEATPPLQLSVDGDKGTPAFVPDKSGKPRQPQLGY